MHQVAVGAAVQAAHQDEGGVRADRVLDLDVVPVDARREVADRGHYETKRVGLSLLRGEIHIPTLEKVVLPRRTVEVRVIDARTRSSAGTLCRCRFRRTGS